MGARCGGKSNLSFSVTVCLSMISPTFTCSRRTNNEDKTIELMVLSSTG